MIQIRPYTLNDWDGICRVHDRSRPLELQGSCDERAFIPLNDDPESSALHQCRLLVACEGDKIIGFTGSHEDFLGWLYLDPDFTGRGIAKQLLKECLKYIGPHAWTVTLAGNKRAKKLYESAGFTVKSSFLSDDEGFPCRVYKMSRD
ncbi:MAG: GNAT family N-acetyltransferase [Verrucomicrobia bacterium]|nr:GNAT family N-acetyltransferase [Verrucomicrobiota bacterium]